MDAMSGGKTDGAKDEAAGQAASRMAFGALLRSLPLRPLPYQGEAREEAESEGAGGA